MLKEKSIEKKAVEIIKNQIGGFHRCYLNEPIHLDYASENFCEMIGYTTEEMDQLFDKLYIGMVHPNDVNKYVDFVHRLAAKEQSLSIEYRMVRKNGEIIRVFDTMLSKRDEYGIMWGMSVVTVLEKDYKGKTDSNVLHEVVPCGTLRFVVSDNQIRILSMNADMKFLLDIKPNITDEEEYLKDDLLNIFPENRRSDFKRYITETDITNKTKNFEITILTKSGHELGVMGWVNKVKNYHDEQNYNEYTAAFVDVTPRVHKEVQERAANLIMSVISVYDVVFEINLIDKTVKCIKDRDGNVEEELKGLRIHITDAFEFIIENIIVEEDRKYMNSFFKNVLDEYQDLNNAAGKEVEFKTHLRDIEKTFSGKIMYFDNALAYFCCIDVSKKQNLMELENENQRLKRENKIAKDIINNTRNNLIELKENDIEDLGLFNYVDFKEKKIRDEKNIYIRTFGYFDIFVNDRPIYFKSKKAKELLAIIVDRRGGYVSAEEAISYMWENDAKTTVSLARHRKVAMRLRETLKQHGVENIIVTLDGKRSINKEIIKCDLYDYLSGKAEYERLFNGLYMVNYSWGEYTLAELENSRKAINYRNDSDNI